MVSRPILRGVGTRHISWDGGPGRSICRREQQGVEQLLANQRQRQPGSRGYLRRPQPLIEVKRASAPAWQQELTGEDIRLELPPLARAVVFNTLQTDRRCLSRTRRVDVGASATCRPGVQTGVTELVRDEQRTSGGVAVALAANRPALIVVECSSAFQRRVACGQPDQLEVIACDCRLDQGQGIESIHALCDQRLAEGRRLDADRLERVHRSKRQQSALLRVG